MAKLLTTLLRPRQTLALPHPSRPRQIVNQAQLMGDHRSLASRVREIPITMVHTLLAHHICTFTNLRSTGHRLPV